METRSRKRVRDREVGDTSGAHLGDRDELAAVKERVAELERERDEVIPLKEVRACHRSGGWFECPVLDAKQDNSFLFKTSPRALVVS